MYLVITTLKDWRYGAMKCTIDKIFSLHLSKNIMSLKLQCFIEELILLKMVSRKVAQ